MPTGTDFFATFNDNFIKNPRSDSTEFVDAFGVESTGDLGRRIVNDLKATKNAVAIGSVDAFEANFANFNLNPTKEKKSGFDDDDDVDGFANFNAFNAANHTTAKTNALTSSSQSIDKMKLSPKKLNLNASDAVAMAVPKFSGDYSKSDQFDDDLQAALQRSLVEQ